MKIKAQKKKIGIMLLGLATAIVLFGIVQATITAIGDIAVIGYLAIPLLVLTVAIYESRLLTYGVSLFVSSVIAVPLIIIISIIAVVVVLGVMPTPT